MMDTRQFISSSETKEKGRTEYYKMLNRVKDGELIQVRRGVYATSEQISGNMIDIESIVPGEFFAFGRHGEYMDLRHHSLRHFT